MDPQLLAVIQGLQEQNNSLIQELRVLREQTATAVEQSQKADADLRDETTQAFGRTRQAFDELHNRVREVATASAAGASASTTYYSTATPPVDKQEQLVDTKAFGKPPVLQSRSGFPSWSFKFVAFVSGANKKIKEAIDWAETFERPITMIDITSKDPDYADLTVQLYLALALQTEGSFNELVENVENQNGLEVWRKLTDLCSPGTRSKRRNRMKHLLEPKDVPKDESQMFTKFERWEKVVRMWEKKSKKSSLIKIPRFLYS